MSPSQACASGEHSVLVYPKGHVACGCLRGDLLYASNLVEEGTPLYFGFAGLHDTLVFYLYPGPAEKLHYVRCSITIHKLEVDPSVGFPLVLRLDEPYSSYFDG